MASDCPVLESLSLKAHTTEGATAAEASSLLMPDDVQHKNIKCLFCEKSYSLLREQNELLKHFMVEHKFVVSDIKLIADFGSYLEYWRRRFKNHPLTDFCSVIKTNSKETDPGPSELYYFLCDALPEDKQIRSQLQQQKLEDVLRQQQTERGDASFSRTCLFCREHFTEKRSLLFDHLKDEHNFNVGRPDNLVYCSEFLDVLEEKMNSLQCLYCEKTFKDRHVLKEHMRKKMHKKINPQNSTYDKFYIINYLELGKNWESLKGEPDTVDRGGDTGEESDAASVDNEWSDWREDGGVQVICLFCDVGAVTTEVIQGHMKDVHKFDLAKTRENLTFYQQVKLINYIRRQVHQNTCPVCQLSLDSREALREHMDREEHTGTSTVPDCILWDQAQYFFPTYEDDALLFDLEDRDASPASDNKNNEKSDTESSLNSSETEVIAEDYPVSIVTESVIGPIREQLLS